MMWPFKTKEQKAQIKRMEDDMSGVLVFTPQCSKCTRRHVMDRDKGKECEAYGEVPDIYKYNEAECPEIIIREEK